MPAWPRLRRYCFVLFDLAVPAGEVQRDLRHVMHGAVTDVPYRDAGVRVPLLDPQEALGCPQLRWRCNAHIKGPDLIEKQQLLVCRLSRKLGAQLDAGLLPVKGGRAPARRTQERPGPPRTGKGHHAELSPAGLELRTARLLPSVAVHRSLLSASFDIVFPELVPEGRTVNPQKLGGGGSVLPALLERGTQDRWLGQLQEPLIELGFIGPRAKVLAFVPGPCDELSLYFATGRRRRRGCRGRWEMLRANSAAPSHDGRVLDGVAQLTDVTRPRSRPESVEDVVREAGFGDVWQLGSVARNARPGQGCRPAGREAAGCGFGTR